MTEPPDRGHLHTEQRHPASHGLDDLPLVDAIDLMADDHQLVIDAVRSARAPLAAFVDALVPRMRAGGRLVYLGAGTSGRLGVLDASECPPTFQSDPDQVVGLIAGGDAALRRSSEAREDDPAGSHAVLAEVGLGTQDTLLGIAAGGTTPYVRGGIEHAASRGAMTGLLTCVTIEPPAGCDHLLVLPSGPELLTGSTRLKAGSATKLALNIISTMTFVRLGKVYSNLMVDLRATNQKLADRAARILQTLCPALDRAAALAALDDAHGDLKTAVVMQRRGTDASTAAALLLEADGHLRALLDDAPVRATST